MIQRINLFNLDDLSEQQTREFVLASQAIFAVKKDGQVYLYENTCPHLHISLNFMPDAFLDQEGSFITCANHGALFEIETGLCVAGPCLGRSLTPIEFEVCDGVVQL